jgi:hypothetical protein
MFNPVCTYPKNSSDFRDNKQYTVRKIYKKIKIINNGPTITHPKGVIYTSAK